MKTFVYRNLHKKCYSLRGITPRRVFAHEKFIVLENAIFQVNQNGRLKVLAEQQKNVHAGVNGNLKLVGYEAICHFHAHKSFWQEVYYNPYKTTSFVLRESNTPIYEAKEVFLSPRGVWCLTELP